MDHRSLDDAVRLMDRAWIQRGESILRPPESAEELDRLVHSVYQQLVEAVEICRAIGAGTELVHALRKLGHVTEDMGRYDESLSLYREAVAICSDLGDKNLQAHTLRHLGDIYRARGLFVRAAAWYTESLQLYRDLEQAPVLDMANAVRPMALVAEALGEVERARLLWQEAHDLYAEAGIAEGVNECNVHLKNLEANGDV